MGKKNERRTGWRAWSVAETPEGPMLSAPFTEEEMRQQYLFPDRFATATCPLSVERHEAPHPDCSCGMYVMTKTENLDWWCYPADVVAEVVLHGPVMKGHNGVFWRGERRCKAIEIVPGPARIAPRVAHLAPGLTERYGLAFTVDPELEKKCGVDRVAASIESSLSDMAMLWEAFAPEGTPRPF